MEHYTTHIKSKTGWFEIDFKELFRYRDLIYLFYKRNYGTRYKQTILGPLWLVINPLITVTLYAFVFGNIANLSTADVPQIVFYLCSNALWSFFSVSLIETSNTFTANSAIMGKVYFPRLVMPISSVLTGMLDCLIQLIMLAVIMIVYALNGVHYSIGLSILLSPIIMLQTAILGLGCGIIIAALTTKYRDLSILVGFGVQLWMYASPVVYTTSIIPQKYYGIYMLNPMAAIMETWRYVLIGAGTPDIGYWAISWGVTIVIFFTGVLLFNKIEKIFMDTV